MLLKRFFSTSGGQLRRFSALYLTGDKAREEYASVHPYLDFQGVLGNREALQESLEKRNCSINLQDLYSQWKKYKNIQEQKKSMEQRREEIVRILKESPGLKSDNVESLKAEGKQLRNTLTDLKENSYEFEEEFINKFLELPNLIQSQSKDRVIYTYLTKDSSAKPSGLSSDLICKDSIYFSKGDLAKFEFFFPIFCQKFFKLKGFEYFSNPDFARSVIVEAAGMPKDYLYRVLEDEGSKINLLHLTGGSSMLSFLSFIARLSVFPKQLPLAFIANGKNYCKNNPRNQGNSVQLFYASSSKENAEEFIDKIVKDFREIYEKFSNHFRIINVPPEKLESSELMRFSLEFYSSTREDYSEVASVSFHGDFISKRLLFNFKEGKEFKFPQIVTATICDTSKLSEVLLENHTDFCELLKIFK
ncbi:serine--tRNA synthetase-like protein Slimp [Phlebotomus papatasi]|uniref:serine--tRNA synthetase-like protein Slimp n=1 Tax=Phlebotomus papatasi TaxID=29031 RepID=UPI002483B367|nr:serine--tRNA synthetase-like protein Slimp [Phlebotomus papatasi]